MHQFSCYMEDKPNIGVSDSYSTCSWLCLIFLRSARFIPGTGQDDVVTEFDYDVGHAFDSKPQLITNPGNGFPGKSYRRAKLRSSQLSQIHEWAQPKPKAAHVKLRGSHRHDAVSMTRIYDSLMLCPDAAHAVLIRSTTADNELENDLTWFDQNWIHWWPFISSRLRAHTTPK